MAKIGEKSGTYLRIGTRSAASDSGSDLPMEVAPGIGSRISAAAEDVVTRKSAADVMGVSTDALQRYVREENQPTFAAIARLCAASGRSLAWMASGHEPPDAAGAGPLEASHDLSEQHLTVALELADNALASIDRWLPRPQYALFVRLLYQGIANGLPNAQITQLASALANSMARGGRNDSESGVGESGPGGAGGSGSKAPGQGDW